MVIFEMKIDLHLNIDMKKGKIYEIYGQTLKKKPHFCSGLFSRKFRLFIFSSILSSKINLCELEATII